MYLYRFILHGTNDEATKKLFNLHSLRCYDKSACEGCGQSLMMCGSEERCGTLDQLQGTISASMHGFLT